MTKRERPDDLSIPEDLSVPDFLKVANRSPPGTQASAPRGLRAPTQPDPMEGLSDASRTRLEALVRAGKYRLHWLKEPGALEDVERRTLELAQKRQENIDRLKALPRKEKPQKPVFGAGARLKVIAQTSRKPGSKSAAIYSEMVEWTKKNPDGDVARLIKETRYHKGFYLADLEKGNVKADVK